MDGPQLPARSIQDKPMGNSRTWRVGNGRTENQRGAGRTARWKGVILSSACGCAESSAPPTMLSQTADHALRALLAIARHADTRRGATRPLRVEEIAELIGAPRNYLGKT